jgi:hypothetical protein
MQCPFRAYQRIAFVLCVVQFSSSPATAQPSAIGQWTNEFTWGQFGGIEAIHIHLLPTGKVMFWQGWRESIGLWDPVTNQFAGAALPNPTSYNPICSGHAWLPDGRLLIAGGNINISDGLNLANIYNPFTNTWANNVPNMPNVPTGAPYGAGRNGRWYPSATTLGNGDILVMSGAMNGLPPGSESDTNPLPQVYQVATNSWRNLTTAYLELPLYPRTFLAPNGNVASLSDYGNKTRFLNSAGTGQWLTQTATTPDPDLNNYGSAVMYDAGKVAYFGGGNTPTKNVSLIDLNVANPTWTFGIEDLAQPRRHNNATILADGTVLITGGTSTTGWNDGAGRVSVAEIWNPKTQHVTQVAQADPAIYRGYHATALLLPDGRVLSAGGNHDHDYNPNTPDYENRNAEIYSPAYLFKGSRPTVTSAPDIAQLGRSIFVTTPNAASIADVTLIAPGSVTHAQNWTQRANHLKFTVVDGGLAITLPSNANAAPPGYYMMFLINNNGVPSIAEWLRATLPTGLVGDFNNDNVVNAADYAVWRKGRGTKYTPADLVDWRMHFGEKSGAGSGASVPEPEALLLLVIAAACVGSQFRRKRERLSDTIAVRRTCTCG